MKRLNRWNASVWLLLAVSVPLAACGAAETASTGTVISAQDVAVTPGSNDTVQSPQLPSHEDEVDLSWTESELSGVTYIDNVIVTPEGFIAYRTEDDVRAWVSPDGISWSEADLEFGTPEVLEFGTSEDLDFHSVTAGGSGYVALGGASERDQLLWTSEDGLSWESYPVNLEIPPGEFDGFHSAVSFDGGLLLTGSFIDRDDEGHGHSAFLAYSEDGISWEVLPDHETLFGPGAQVGEVLSAGSGLIVAGYVEEEGGGEQIWYSADGRTWEESSAEFLTSSDFSIGPDTVRWGDKVLIVGNSDAGIRLHTSVDGREWEELSPNPLLEHTEESEVYVQQVAAGPFGIAIVAQREPVQQAPPVVTIEKDGVAVTVQFESGSIAVADVATGALIFETNVDDEDLVRIDDEVGTVTFFGPDSGEELTSYTFEEFELAMDQALEDAGYENPGDYQQESPVLLFSPDGQRWSIVNSEELVGLDNNWMGIVVGSEAVIVRFPDPIEYEEGSEEEPPSLYGEAPDLVWVGRAGGDG